MPKTGKAVPVTPMPRSERYLSQAAVKAAEQAFGAVEIRKKSEKK